MYKIKLDNYNKRLERSIKGLNKGKEYSLREADSFIKQLHEKTTERISLIISVVDYDSDNTYEFNKSFIDPEDTSPDLIEMLQEELLSEEGLEKSFINKLLNGLEEQIEAEEFSPVANSPEPKKKGFGLLKPKKAKPAKSEEEKPFAATFEVPEKGNFLFGKRSPKKENKVAAETEGFGNDFAELDSIHEEEEHDFADLGVEEVTYSNEEEIDGSYEAEEEATVAEDFGAEEYDPFADEEEEYDPFNETESHLEGYGEDVESEEEINEPKYQSNSKEVYFPEYDKYLDMSAVENTIQRQNSRLEKEHLVKFLGLNALSSDTALTELDNLKLNYALNSLEESKFMLIKDYFNVSVQTIKDKTQNGLAQIYEQVMTFDYQEEAKKELSEQIESVRVETENEYAAYLTGQEDEYNQKLAKFKLEQERALEDFIRQQELEMNQLVQELDTKKEARLSVYKDNMQRNLSNQKEQMVDEKVVELKYNSINSMIEAKRKSIRSFEAELDNAVDDTWEQTQQAIEELKQEIEARIPAWKNEIEEKRKLEAEQREEARKEESLALERQRIEVQLQQLEFSKNKKVEDEESKIAALLEQRFNQYDTKIAETLQGISDPKEVTVVSEPQQNKLNATMKPNILKKYFTASAVVLLALGGGALATTVLNKEPEAQAQAQEEITEYERLAQAIEALEEKLAVNEQPDTEEENKPSLDSLLAEKNYEKAMSLYKEQESLDKIEETLYKNKDLAYLVTFNKVNESVFGKLDEAILSKDDKKVSEIYQALSDESKGKLSDERKNDIALSLYQLDQKDLANKLLAKGEKE